MAQSKKNLLKRIDRHCVRLNPRVKYVVAQQRNHAIDDEFGMIWGDAYELLHELQRVHPGTLERSRQGRVPVTYQQASMLYERLQTFSQRMLSSR
jgi:hypothetical protein